jgi:hypothetical protein
MHVLISHCASVCFGETPGGNDFEKLCVDFDQHITQAFQAFLRLCFSECYMFLSRDQGLMVIFQVRRTLRLCLFQQPMSVQTRGQSSGLWHL